MTKFTVYPAIDLRNGQVVRLKEGDPERQTNYASDPAKTAENWLQAGASWLHVINLDGAFGDSDSANRTALRNILEVTSRYNAKVQFGGGLRSLSIIEDIIKMGVSRAILGTLAVEQPETLETALVNYGSEKIAVSLDARQGLVHVHGWQEATNIPAQNIADDLQQMGLSWLIFTDIARDGLQKGVNLPATVELARSSGLSVIASGGVRDWEDIRGAYENRLAGIIVGRALYENKFDPSELLHFPSETNE
jgi:phosphoribosylformimino-5-aminoimidazole carboxamide ribotide isomerase